MLYEIVSLVSVAALWGATNPFIKSGSKGIENIKSNTRVGQFVSEVVYLATNWKYLVPFALNQTGSILYVVVLQNVHLSLAVPVTNSLTFVFTEIAGRINGEKPASSSTCFGMVVVLAGITLCVVDKYLQYPS